MISIYKLQTVDQASKQKYWGFGIQKFGCSIQDKYFPGLNMKKKGKNWSEWVFVNCFIFRLYCTYDVFLTFI